MNNRRCRLCTDLAPSRTRAKWNEPLVDTSNFIVTPSIGALVEGWLLVIPKQHAISMGALEDSLLAELNEVKEILAQVLETQYGPVCAFEHGPSRNNCAVGCGVDHAHLHLVPCNFDLASAVEPYLPAGATWRSAQLSDCQAAHRADQDYLYYEQPNRVGYISTHQNFGSQTFRRAFANAHAVPGQFNWQEHDQLPNVLATIANAHKWTGNLTVWQNQIAVVA